MPFAYRWSTLVPRRGSRFRIWCMALGLLPAACSPRAGDAPTEPPPPTESETDFRLSCLPAALRVPRTSTSTLSCTLTMPPALTHSVTVTGHGFPAGVRFHLIGSDTTPMLPAGSSQLLFLAVDVDSTVAAGAYAGQLRVQAGAAYQQVAAPLEVTTFPARVRMVYLLPTDQELDPHVAWGMERAIRHLQIFYQQQLGSGGTFAIHFPVVDVVRASRPTSDFVADPWNTAMDETFRSLGGSLHDPVNIWAIYIDVVPTGPTGGAASVAVLPHGDVIGVIGHNGPIGRWVGGLGHEVGHAMGLPHPPGCDENQITDDSWSLMCWGYTRYSATWIAEAQRPILLQSGFVSTLATTTPVPFDENILGPPLVPASTGVAESRALAGMTRLPALEIRPTAEKTVGPTVPLSHGGPHEHDRRRGGRRSASDQSSLNGSRRSAP